jgi:hypothetical protein
MTSMTETESGIRESFERVLRTGLMTLIGAYVLGMTCAVPYYNVSYAAENGFDDWFLGGEVAATFKGALWPYFMIVDEGSPFKQQPSLNPS